MTGLQPRLARDDDGGRVWLVAGERDGVARLCLVRAGPGPLGNGECGELTKLARDGATGWAPPRNGRPGMLLMLLPQGARDVRLTATDGTAIAAAPENGIVFVTLTRTVTSSGWTDAAGVRHIEQLEHVDPRLPSGCRQLDPLPAGADAKARQVALMMAGFFYPGIERASVTRVGPVRPGFCTRAVTDRSLLVSLRLVPRSAAARRSASLTQGRLLVGMVHGRMAVWSVQH
jgi:hypothetical protein